MCKSAALEAQSSLYAALNESGRPGHLADLDKLMVDVRALLSAEDLCSATHPSGPEETCLHAMQKADDVARHEIERVNAALAHHQKDFLAALQAQTASLVSYEGLYHECTGSYPDVPP